jgi:hypothetical protein
MSILQSIKFLFKSSETRTNHIKQQIDGLKAHQVTDKNNTAFKYIDDGFYLHTYVGDSFYRWRDIELITAYKADLLTYDDLRLDMDFGEVGLTLSEDLAGWSEFVDMLPRKLPGILRDWEEKVLHTPFATNLTLIYTRKVDPEDGN